MKKILGTALAVLAASFLHSAQAVTCYAVDEGNMLYKFNSATPGTTTATAVSGLPMGYRIVGLDFRTTVRPGATNPGVGSLWALTTNGTQARLFSINPATAAATAIGNISLSAMMLAGGDNAWFFGFDPATDTLRVMNFIYNYSVNPNTLAATAQTQFNAMGVSNPNNFPALNGSAYTAAPYGGTSQIYFLEQGNDGINTSTNIATGNYSALPMPMNVAFAQPGALDIDSSAWLAAVFNSSGGANKTQLFSFTASGTFTLIGDISATPGTLSLRALAIQPTSFPAPVPVTVSVSGKKKITTTKTSLKIKGTASSTSGITLVQYKVGKGGFKTAKGTTSWNFKAKLKPGTNKIQVKATGGNGVVSSVATIKVTLTK